MYTRTTSFAALPGLLLMLTACETCESRPTRVDVPTTPDAAPNATPSPAASPDLETTLTEVPDAGEQTPLEAGNPTPATSPEPGISEPPPPPPPPLPQIDELQHVLGAWGDVLQVHGTALQGTTPNSAVISVGDELRLQRDDSAVVAWSDTSIQFRVPFPYEGEVFIETREGRVAAGSFESEWVLQEALPDLAEQVVTSLSPAPMTLVLALMGEHLRLAQFDATGWRTLSIESDDLLPDSFHLYQLADETVAGFAISDTQPPELVSFDVLDFDAQGPVAGHATGETLGAHWVAAGSTHGGVVWTENAEGWERLRATPEGWTWDKGPIPTPALDQVTAGTTSDGSLYFAHAVDTGNFLDDLGAPFYRRLSPWQTEFGPDVRGGVSVDDYLSSLTFKSHGRGFLIEYCGTDTDPFNLSGDTYRCYSAAHSLEGDAQLRGLKEKDGARHVFTRDRVGVAYCSEQSELRVSLNRDLEPGAVVTWPCADARRLELDPNGAWLPVVSVDGSLHVLSSSKHSTVSLPTEAGVSAEAGTTQAADAAPLPDAASGPDATSSPDAAVALP